MVFNMNKILTYFVVLILYSTILISAPYVSYIIPDIGAPGMNIYVEFIAPYNQKGTFGTDGFYLNNSKSQIRVFPQNNEDKEKIKVGPIVVSWEGRLISTQIFIRPDLKPNSYDALVLNNEFRIPLVVSVNGDISNVQTFYIVKSRPFFDGTKNPNDTIFGEGILGLRSPRGAMIFDSIRLGNHRYLVSSQDCDGNTNGNQAYLPFNLLVKGKIEGSTNSIIDVSAIRKNGGPGGGGGGGRFYDAFLTALSDIGDDGGDGYVGGGAGGRNRSGMGVEDAFKSPGRGSGANGNSLNLVPYPENQAYESAAGGTGHPFGVSGTSCSNGSNCNPEGGYGAGSGQPQNSQGGSASYSTLANGPSAGKIYGNSMNIPFAGGSGGAGGNPNFPGAYSGNGGGGGGAISISASIIKNIRVNANGAAGSEPSGGIGNVAYGGNGSGGAINLLSKSSVENVSLEVKGGDINSKSGGNGRYRADCNHTMGLPTLLTSGASFYSGIRSDTTQYISQSSASIDFNQAIQGDNISSKIYYASFDGEWVDTGISLTDPAGTQTLNQNIDTTEKYHCIVFMQNTHNNNINEYQREPSFVMSQAAANLLILDMKPILVADTIAENMAITCIGYERNIKTIIKNGATTGENLEIHLSNNNWLLGNNGFEIVSPLGNVSIKPGDSIELIVKYQYTGGEKQNISNMLFFNHNDTDINKANPWIIEFKVGDAFLPGMKIEGDFAFPDTRINGKSSRTFDLKNIGEAPLLIKDINSIEPPFYVVGTNPTLPKELLPGESLKIHIEFRPTEEKDYYSALKMLSYVTDSTCAAFNQVELYGKGVQSQIYVNTNEIDFGLIAWCDEKEEIISIQNPKSATVSFSLISKAEIVGDNPDAFLITNPKNPPITITPGDGTQFNIRINGKQAGSGKKKAKFRIETDVPEAKVIEIDLYAEIADFQVITNQNPVDLANLEIGFDKVATLTLTNLGLIEEKVKEIFANNSNNVKNITASNLVLAPKNGKSNISFTFKAIDTTEKNNNLIVVFDTPCNDTIIIPINVNYILSQVSAEDLNGTQDFYTNNALIDTLDFGKLSPCHIANLNGIVYTNLSNARYILLNENIVNLGKDAFFKVGNGLINDTINPKNKRIALQINFDPKGLSEGVYFAEYEATLYINGQIIQKKIILKGEVVEGKLQIIPQTYNFSSVVGLSQEIEFTAKNIGGYDVFIDDIDLPEYPIFEINPDLMNTTLPINQEIKFKVKFLPSEVKKYQDSIVFSIKTGDCDKEYIVFLNGEGKPSKKLHIYIPKLETEPTLNNFKIPIFAKLDKRNDELIDFEIDSITISMHRSIFYPNRIINGELFSSTLNGDDRILTFKIKNINVKNDDNIIAEIEGYTLLGDTNYTDINIEKINYSMKTLVSSITIENGSLTTNICKEGGDRFLKINGIGNVVAVNPNPASDYLNISVNTIEIGNFQLSIVDNLGKENIITQWNNNNSSEIKTITVNSSGINTGTYIIKLQTPTEILTTRFIIIK